MSPVPHTRQQLLEVLNRIAGGEPDTVARTRDLRGALLDFASATPDNRTCAERIGVGRVDDETGLTLSDRGLLLSEVAHALESEPLPAELKTTPPEISEQDWNAFTRLTTLLYILLGYEAVATRPAETGESRDGPG